MKVRHSNIPVLLLLIIMFGCPQNLLGRQQLGLVWDDSADETLTAANLQQYQQLGFQYLELKEPLPSGFLPAKLPEGFKILIRSSEAYLLPSEVQLTRQELIDKYRRFNQQYSNLGQVHALGLFSHSAAFDENFQNSFIPILNSLEQLTPISLYFYQNRHWWYWNEITPETKPFASLFTAESNSGNDLIHFNEAMSLSRPGDILFVKATWLRNALNNYPELEQSLKYFHQNGDWKLPLPEEEADHHEFKWTVFLLLLMWIITAVTFKVVPPYRSILYRYFTAHRFLVEDILQYLERSYTGGLIMILQHAVSGGLVFYILSDTFLTDTGLIALFHHYPLLAIAGQNLISVFIAGTLLVFLLEMLALAWIYFPGEALQHISQAVNLYSGILHVDLIFLTAMVALHNTGTSPLLLVALGLIYLFVWFMAFNIAAYDAAQNLMQERGRYLFYTVGLHSVIAITTFILLLAFTNLPHVLSLALSV